MHLWPRIDRRWTPWNALAVQVVRPASLTEPKSGLGAAAHRAAHGPNLLPKPHCAHINTFLRHYLSAFSLLALPRRVLFSSSALCPAEPSVKKPHPNRPKPAASIVILEDDLEERFIKGSGNGGQKINKTSSRVQLRHKPTDIMIECQETRSRSQNRKIARQRLRDKLDELYNGAQSKAARQAEKLRKRKQRRRQKSKKKYAAPASED